MPTSLCWKGKAIVCGKVKSKSRHGARKHDSTVLHPSPSRRLSPTAQHAPPLQPLGPASGFQPLPTRLFSGVGPLRFTPGQRTPSGAQPGRTPSAPGAFSSLLLAGLGRNQVAAASSWLPRIPGSETPLGPAAACSPIDRPSANRRSLKKPRLLMRANIYCRFAEFTWDVEENQIIRQVLHLLSGWGFRSSLRLKLSQLDSA